MSGGPPLEPCMVSSGLLLSLWNGATTPLVPGREDGSGLIGCRGRSALNESISSVHGLLE
jgi:hypothetical protein